MGSSGWRGCTGCRGCVVATLVAGEPSSTAFAGVAHAGGNEAVDASTTFEVASVSKVVSAWTALALVADGHLDLDEPVAPHLHRWTPSWSRSDADTITLRTLLSHTAGLPSGAAPPLPTISEVPDIVDVVAGADSTPAAVPVVPPQTQFRYSNPGYALIQLLIEDVTSESFERWAQHRIIEPLGMRNTTYQRTLPAHHAAPHRRTGRRLADGFYNQQAAGGLHTTATDLLALARAMTTAHPQGPGGGVLPAALVEESWRTPPAALGAYRLRSGGYSLGLISTVLPSGARLVANQGSRVGWRAFFACAPERGDALAITSNSNTGGLLLAHVALRWLASVNGSFRSLRRVIRVRKPANRPPQQ